MNTHSYLSPKGSPIIGTLMHMVARADIVGIKENGEPDFSGNTEILWDCEAIEQKKDGKLIFLTAEGEEFTLDQLIRTSVRPLACRTCGEPMFIDPSGVSNHGVPGDILYDHSHVAVADESPDGPTDITVERGDFMVRLEWLGEGVNGDYDPSDHEDEPMLRFTAFHREAGCEFEEIPDGSYCIQISDNAPLDLKHKAAITILTGVEKSQWLKRTCEALSWLAIKDGDLSLNFSDLP